MTDDVQSFSALLRGALGERIDRDATSFTDMFAEDGVMEFPFAALGMARRVTGRGPLEAYLAALGEKIVFDRVGGAVVHETRDPEVVIVEFEGSGRGLATGRPYEQRYISVIRARGGRIVHYRDYWNPIAILSATGSPTADAVPAPGEASRG